MRTCSLKAKSHHAVPPKRRTCTGIPVPTVHGRLFFLRFFLQKPGVLADIFQAFNYSASEIGCSV